jgi:hypothetical protein
MDWTLHLYGAHAVVDLIGLAMMTWWLYTLKEADKHPSIFYICLWLMFLGGVVNQGIMCYARSLRWCSPDAFDTFVSGWWWPARLIVNLGANITVVCVLLYRRFLYSKAD